MPVCSGAVKTGLEEGEGAVKRGSEELGEGDSILLLKGSKSVRILPHS